MDVQPTNLQQLRDAIKSIWTKISEDCFQHLVARISGCLADTSAWMKEHHLQLNLAKTELLVFPATPTLQHDFTIQLSSSTITPLSRQHNFLSRPLSFLDWTTAMLLWLDFHQAQSNTHTYIYTHTLLNVGQTSLLIYKILSFEKEPNVSSINQKHNRINSIMLLVKVNNSIIFQPKVKINLTYIQRSFKVTFCVYHGKTVVKCSGLSVTCCFSVSLRLLY